MMLGDGGVVLSQTAALFRVYHALKHGAEDVGIDFRPVEFAAFEQKAAGALIEIGGWARLPGKARR